MLNNDGNGNRKMHEHPRDTGNSYNQWVTPERHRKLELLKQTKQNFLFLLKRVLCCSIRVGSRRCSQLEPIFWQKNKIKTTLSRLEVRWCSWRFFPSLNLLQPDKVTAFSLHTLMAQRIVDRFVDASESVQRSNGVLGPFIFTPCLFFWPIYEQFYFDSV